LKPTPYATPNAPVRDLSPETPGPIPDWIAVMVGLATNKFLGMIVADQISSLFALIVAPGEAAFETASLVIDLALTYSGELFSFWLTLQICRSRSLGAVGILAALSWTITFGDRWILEDYGWPLWYESALLCVAPLALITLYARKHRRNVVA
jgi:hypothetical protein